MPLKKKQKLTIACFHGRLYGTLFEEENAVKKMLLLAAAVLLMLPAAAFGETQTITLTCAGSFMPGSNDKVSTQAYAFHRYIEQ